MESPDLIEVKGKLVRGVFALATRTFLLQAISFFATFVLTVLLSPSAFGVFFVVSAVIGFLSYFSDIGFAAALIQKKDEPKEEEYATAFTVQQILVVSLVVGGIWATPFISEFYHLQQDGIILFQFLLLSFLLSSLKTIPSVLLERKLAFSLFVIPQILETIAFYVLAIVLAVMEYGIVSFAWAALLRGVVGLVTIFIISPWKIRVGISRKALGHLLSYGVPFQMNSLLALVKDDLLTIVLGKMLPFAQVGYIGWAKKWAEAPLRLIMDNIIRVTFPAFSRLQADKKILEHAIEKTFFFLAFFIFPATAVLILLIQPAISSFPQYAKWEPAVFSFYLFAAASLFASFSSPIVNALNAIGKIRTTLGLMIMWTILTWAVVPLFVFLFGYEGVAIGASVISISAVVPIAVMQKIIPFRVFTPLYKPFIATICMVLVFLALHQKTDAFNLTVSVMAGVFTYLFVSFVWMKNEILPYFPKLGFVWKYVVQ